MTAMPAESFYAQQSFEQDTNTTLRRFGIYCVRVQVPQRRFRMQKLTRPPITHTYLGRVTALLESNKLAELEENYQARAAGMLLAEYDAF